MYTRNILKTFHLYTRNTPERQTLNLHMEQTNLNITTNFTPGIGQFPLICY